MKRKIHNNYFMHIQRIKTDKRTQILNKENIDNLFKRNKSFKICLKKKYSGIGYMLSFYNISPNQWNNKNSLINSHSAFKAKEALFYLFEKYNARSYKLYNINSKNNAILRKK